MDYGHILIPAPLMFLMMLYLMNQNRSNSNSSGTPKPPLQDQTAGRRAELEELARLQAQIAEQGHRSRTHAQSLRDKQSNRVFQHLRGVDYPTLTQAEFVAWLDESALTPKHLNLVLNSLSGIHGKFRAEDYWDFERDVYCRLVGYKLTTRQCEQVWERIRESLDYFQPDGVTFGLIQQFFFRQSSKLRGELLAALLAQHRVEEMFFDERWDKIVNDLCDDEKLDAGLRQQLRHEHAEARANGY